MNAFYLIYVGLILAYLYGGMSSVPLWTLGPMFVLTLIARSITRMMLTRSRPGADHFDVFGEDE